MQSLAGKTALVTGADRGIGAGIASALEEQGVRVCRNFLLFPTITESSSALNVQADLREPDQIQRLFAVIEKEFGGLDILINNAGVESIVPAIDLKAEEWDRVFNTNLRGAFLCAQGAARLMKMKTSGGVIINISSIHDEIPRLGTAHYCASKAGMTMLTKSLAREWAEYKIRVVGISPGIIETDINREAIERFGRKRFLDWVPLKSLGTISDVANAVLFLASDDARYISGTSLIVDGAYSLSTVQYDPRSPNP